MDSTVRRGQERYDIYCTPCHDSAGTGKGTVSRAEWRRRRASTKSASARCLTPAVREHQQRHSQHARLQLFDSGERPLAICHLRAALELSQVGSSDRERRQSQTAWPPSSESPRYGLGKRLEDAAAVAAIGVLVAIAGAFMQSERFAFSYLYCFITVMTIWLGSVFFVLIQPSPVAGWSVTVRRTSSSSSLCGGPADLFLPLLAHLDTLYPWWNHHGCGERGRTRPGSRRAPVKRIERDDPHVVRGTAVIRPMMHASAAHVGRRSARRRPTHLLDRSCSTRSRVPEPGLLLRGALRLLRHLAVAGVALFRKSVAQDATRDMKYTNDSGSSRPTRRSVRDVADVCGLRLGDVARAELVL